MVLLTLNCMFPPFDIKSHNKRKKTAQDAQRSPNREQENLKAKSTGERMKVLKVHRKWWQPKFLKHCTRTRVSQYNNCNSSLLRNSCKLKNKTWTPERYRTPCDDKRNSPQLCSDFINIGSNCHVNCLFSVLKHVSVIEDLKRK